MKKLMTVFGAAVMSLGLFAAAEDNYSSTSFEANDAGCSNGQTFNLSQATDWSTTSTDTFALVAQDMSALPYPAEGVKARRDDFFNARNINDKCLKLEIPEDTLECAIGEGQIFVDQLVKFSEYDNNPEPVEGSKIAMWMKADDSGETSLYASVGTGLGVANVQIGGEYVPDKWYRLTIKSLGNVRNSGILAGFLVYINGDLVSIVEDDKDYLDADVAGDLVEDASEYYAQGRLFASMDTRSAEIESVGYTGYGWVDDLIVSESAPQFAEDPYTFTIEPPTGLEVVSVEANGEELDEPYIVPPGTTVRITYVAAEGYKITSATAYDDVDINVKDLVIRDELIKVEVAEVCAQLFREGLFFDEYVEGELYDVINSLEDGDQLSFVNEDGSEIKDPEGETLYVFWENTTIDVTIDGELTTWEINSARDGDWITDYVGIDENFVKIYNFEYPNSSVELYGDVAGELSVAWDEEPEEGTALYVEADVMVSGKITAACIENEATITLSGEGKVITQTDELNDVCTDGGSGPEILENTPEEGWYTYQVGTPAPGETFTVTVEPALTHSTVAVLSNETEIAFAETYVGRVDQDIFTVTYTAEDGYFFQDVFGTTTTFTYELTADGDAADAPEPIAIEYTITYSDYGEWIDGFEPVESYTVETETFYLPLAENIAPRAGGEFQNWTNELGEVVTEVEQGSTGDLVLYAAWKQAGINPVDEVIADKVEGYNELSPEDQGTAYANVQHLCNKFEEVELTEYWISIVYGQDAKVPAAKLAATTEELIDISVKYDLPIMTADVKVETAQATDGAFTFKLVDGGEGVNVEAAEIEEMIEWSADLVDFAVNRDEIDVEVEDDNVTIKATFANQNDEPKGFMKLRLFADEK